MNASARLEALGAEYDLPASAARQLGSLLAVLAEEDRKSVV